MALSFDRLVNPTMVAAIGPDSLRRLIAGIAPDLAAPASDKEDDAAALARWLRDVPPEENSGFFERLYSIIRILNQEDLQQILSDRGFPPRPGTPLGEVIVDLALKAPDALDEMSAQASVSEAHSAKVFVTYRRSGAAIRLPKLTPAKIRTLEQACQSALEGVGHGKYCRVWSSMDGDNLALVVAYAASLRSKRVISRADSAELQTNRLPRDAVVLISPDCLELRIAAGSSREREIFAAAVGQLLAASSSQFACTDVFDLDAICKKAFAKKLKQLEGNDFASVSLVQVVLIRRDDLHTHLTVRARDIFEFASSEGFDLDEYEPKRVVFEFVPAERRGRLRWKIEIKGGDSCRCTAPWSNDTVAKILKELGLLRAPRS
jgi:hypothetical protein